ncbi:MAG: hypothetical protein QG564_1143 [Campylobacterota bacterium]|nr:hypothetical protein [Campylobacterota bacterium]
MQAECTVWDEHLGQLSVKVAKSFAITAEEALELIYEEWEKVESLFETHEKIDLVHRYLINEMNELYRIA